MLISYGYNEKYKFSYFSYSIALQYLYTTQFLPRESISAVNNCVWPQLRSNVKVKVKKIFFITSRITLPSQTSRVMTVILPTLQYIMHDVISIIIVILIAEFISKVNDKVV